MTAQAKRSWWIVFVALIMLVGAWVRLWDLDAGSL